MNCAALCLLLLLLLLLLFPGHSAMHTVSVRVSPHFPFHINPGTPDSQSSDIAPIFPILPFRKHLHNPILGPDADWTHYIYNPTATVVDHTVFLLFRAQDAHFTSTIGLAWSHDGIHFTRLSQPVIYPTEPWEKPGGTEDPRLIRVNGTFYLTYTGYDGSTARLCLATSTDLVNWRKYPPILSELGWTKSGAIMREPTPDGVYHMFFGEGSLYHATSPDLIEWTPTTTGAEPFAQPVYSWEDELIEPGPAPIKTIDGRWILIYNGKTSGRDQTYLPGQYSVGQMLIDPGALNRPADQHKLSSASPKPNGPIARIERPLLVPETKEELHGLVDKVVFAEGLVQFKGKWFLYYGQADSTIGVAIADVEVSRSETVKLRHEDVLTGPAHSFISDSGLREQQ